MESITSLLSIALGAVLVNNFVLSQFLGICPFMGVSKRLKPLWAWAWQLSS